MRKESIDPIMQRTAATPRCVDVLDCRCAWAAMAAAAASSSSSVQVAAGCERDTDGVESAC